MSTYKEENKNNIIIKKSPEEELLLIINYCEKRGGKLLENEYRGVNKKYRVRCKNDHIFDLNWAQAKYRSYWCPLCAGNRVDPIKEMKLIHEYCKNHGGKCIENKYKGCAREYNCVCENEHNFQLNWNHAKTREDWCKFCAPNYTDPIKEMELIHKYCEERGGKCLESEYKGSDKKYKCICKNEHKFDLNWGSAKRQKNWCGFCLIKKRNETQKIHEYCKEHGGKCLENEYKGCNKKYKCVCKNGHEFSLNWNAAKTRRLWCNMCRLEKIQNRNK